MAQQDIRLVDWSHRFYRLMKRWPYENDPRIPFFTLPGPSDPLHIKPVSLAIVVNGEFVGRFTYRFDGNNAFVGVYLATFARNTGVGRCACRLGLDAVARLGAKGAWCWVAAPNLAAMLLNTSLGYQHTNVVEWREIGDLDSRIMWRFDTAHWRYLDEDGGPSPAILYKKLCLPDICAVL